MCFCQDGNMVHSESLNLLYTYMFFCVPIGVIQIFIFVVWYGRTKSDRKIGSHTSEQMQAALDVVKKGNSIRQTAIFPNVPFATL